MVTGPGETTRPAALQPLNAPQPVQVKTGPDGAPLSVQVTGRQPAGKSGQARPRTAPAAWVGVAAIDDMWKILDEWWRGSEHEMRRTYYALLMEDGRRLTVFHDGMSGGWMRQAG